MKAFRIRLIKGDIVTGFFEITADHGIWAMDANFNILRPGEIPQYDAFEMGFQYPERWYFEGDIIRLLSSKSTGPKGRIKYDGSAFYVEWGVGQGTASDLLSDVGKIVFTGNNHN